MPRYTLDIDDETYTRIKLHAATEERSIGWILRKLIVEALNHREALKEGK